MNKKVLVGMSGGVDSSASAAILKEKGYDVIGCTMKLFEKENENNESIEDAKRVCEKLEINHIVLDLKNEFKCKVIDYFIKEYENARTPNPCVECNKYLKFNAFLKKAKELECDYIATGHYAKIEYSEKYDRYVLKKSNEEKKDQTYFLYNIKKENIKHLIFPLQDNYSKELTRQIASDNGLEVAKKKDSQEICFIENNDYQDFLNKNMTKKQNEGEIVLKSTKEVLGTHTGLMNYTIGQRKGLKVSYKTPLYVIELDSKKNKVIVGNEEDLYKNTLYTNNVNWLAIDDIEDNLEVYAKIRYRSKEAKAVVSKFKDDIYKVEFDEPQRAITKGQSVVFYDEDSIVIGGGKII